MSTLSDPHNMIFWFVQIIFVILVLVCKRTIQFVSLNPYHSILVHQFVVGVVAQMGASN